LYYPDFCRCALVNKTRKSHSEFPAIESKPQTIHDDLVIVYLDLSGSPNKAIYFDNEGTSKKRN
jgi:hypothetical protein